MSYTESRYATADSFMKLWFILYFLSSAINGYYTQRFFKFFGGIDWFKIGIFTAFALPGCGFGVFFLVNFFLWTEKSDAAVKHIFIKILDAS
jgi:hypothetical protein